MALHKPKSSGAIRVTKGKLESWDFETKTTESYSDVDGVLSAVRMGRDEGNKEAGVRPFDLLEVVMPDDETPQVLQFRYPSVSSNMFAQALNDIKAGDRIKVHVWPSKDNEKITNCMVSKVDSNGAWVQCEREDWSEMSGDFESKIARADEIIRNHPAFEGDRGIPESAKTVQAVRQEAEYDPFAD